MQLEKVIILMSTYNGERFLTEQIESIRQQTFSNWQLWIRDDGSTDHTIAIIKRFSELDSRILFLTDTLGNLKPSQSFSVLLNHFLQKDGEFVFFADQDDVWLENKLEIQVEKLQEMTEQFGKNTPALVFSDLKVVDATLEVLHPSFLQFEHLFPNSEQPLNKLLIHNYIPGCVSGINRSLARLAYPIPEAALMHDWWCALCAAATGNIAFIPQATLLYRQHSANDIGAQGYQNKLKKILFSWKAWKARWRYQQESLYKRWQQADALQGRLQSVKVSSNVVDKFCSFIRVSPLLRPYFFYKNRFIPDGIMRKLSLIIFLIILKKTGKQIDMKSE